jgi:hypothetical protein
LTYNKSTEATFDMNGEHAAPQYEKVKVLTSQASANGLPRLGLRAQSQESLSKKMPSATGDRHAEATVPMQPTLLANKPPSNVQPTSINVQEKLEANQEFSSTARFGANYLAEDLGGKGGEEEREQSPVMKKEIKPEDQTLEQKGDSSVEAAAVEEEAPSSGLALELVFDVKGEKKIIQLLRRPLGAEFTKRVKGCTKIENIRPHSYASELGMEVGWAITSIGGEDVGEKSYTEVQAELKNGMMALPLHA